MHASIYVLRVNINHHYQINTDILLIIIIRSTRIFWVIAILGETLKSTFLWLKCSDKWWLIAMFAGHCNSAKALENGNFYKNEMTGEAQATCTKTRNLGTFLGLIFQRGINLHIWIMKIRTYYIWNKLVNSGLFTSQLHNVIYCIVWYRWPFCSKNQFSTSHNNIYRRAIITQNMRILWYLFSPQIWMYLLNQ